MQCPVCSVRYAVWIGAGLSVSDFIDRLQNEQQEMALVHANGQSSDNVDGFATPPDAFEAISGEREDPVDRTPCRR